MTLEDEWERFAAAYVLPYEAQVDRDKLKAAFFAGATVLMGLQVQIFQCMDNASAFAAMTRLNNECLEFVRAQQEKERGGHKLN